MTVPPVPSPANEPESGALESPDERPQRRREWSGASRSVVLPLVIVGAIVGIIWYLQTGRGTSGATGDESYGIVPLAAARNPTGRPPAAEQGRAAPDFHLEQLEGGTLRLSDLRGQVVILNFWATWCGPCRAEMPEFVRLYEAERSRGLEIVAVDLQEPEEHVRNFADEFGMRFPTLFDRTGAVAQTYRVQQLPVTFIIDRDGTVRATRYGAVTPAWLRAELDKLL